MPLYPLFADLKDKPVLVVGGGVVALRKIESLKHAGARILLVAQDLHPELAAACDAGKIEWLGKAFQATQLDQAWLAVAATDDAILNQTVAAAGQERLKLVNVVDHATLSSFQVPATIERGPLTLAFSTQGIAPALARRLREVFDRWLEPSLGALLTLAEHYRNAIRQRHPQLNSRRRFYDWLYEGPVAAQLAAGRPQEAAAALEQQLAKPISAEEASPQGRVLLVSAGPGDPGLVSLRALRAMHRADVILYDALVSPEVLSMARRDALRTAVGKRGGGGEHTPQEHIHALLLAHARAGQVVVRLKGGDAFVFGRGGEELEFLRAEQIPYEVVPGITAALACAAYAGVPLTHRNHAQAVRLVTAHGKASLDALDWPSLAQERQTLAIYMGVAILERLQERLIAHGRSPHTPFVLVENGSRPEQRSLHGRLDQLSTLASRHAIQAPAMLIVGEVAALAPQLAWFGEVLGESDTAQDQPNTTGNNLGMP